MRCPGITVPASVNDDHPARYPIYAYRTKPHDIRRFLVDLPLCRHTNHPSRYITTRLSTGLLPSQYFATMAEIRKRWSIPGFHIIAASSFNLKIEKVRVRNSSASERLKRSWEDEKDFLRFIFERWNNYLLSLKQIVEYNNMNNII